MADGRDDIYAVVPENWAAGALGRRVYDRTNDVVSRAIGLQSPAMCAVEHYTDGKPRPPEWRSGCDDCWKQVEDGLRAIIVDAAKALLEVEHARQQIRWAT
jgi:hypothetical protein